jgi:hypothetical protein
LAWRIYDGIGYREARGVSDVAVTDEREAESDVGERGLHSIRDVADLFLADLTTISQPIDRMQKGIIKTYLRASTYVNPRAHGAGAVHQEAHLGRVGFRLFGFEVRAPLLDRPLDQTAMHQEMIEVSK